MTKKKWNTKKRILSADNHATT